MPNDWKELANGEIAIAHVSDFHFGSKNCEASWDLLAQCLRTRVKPELILVTGDLVDTPSLELYTKAKESLDSLGPRYFVCAGNHDRFKKGNRLSWKEILGRWWFRWGLTLTLVISALFVVLHNVSLWWISFLVLVPAIWFIPWLLDRFWSTEDASAQFHRVFEGKIVSPFRAEPVSVGRGPSAWSIGILGVDSCHDADASARGYVAEQNFQTINQQTAKQDWDLCIFLVHHHLLPIRKLEASRRGSRRDLFNLTCLVNSGSLLETLANARIDLVLHGHEHEHNWAGYSSFSSGQVQLRVIGAGSATGNNSFEGCSINRASFNVFVLSPYRSAKLCRLAYQATDWRVEDELAILSSSDVRRSRIYRSMVPDVEVRSEIVRHVEFTRTRDIWVSILLSNWVLDSNGDFKWEVYNSTGAPTEVKVRLYGPTGYSILEITAEFQKNGDYKRTLTISIPESHRNVALTIEMRYCWQGGAVLTESELDRIRASPAPGYLRSDGFEFATIWSPIPVVSAEIILLMPPEYSPDKIGIKVWDKTGDLPHEAAELTTRLRPLAAGSYAFRIPFPHIYRDYALVWRPVSVEGSGADGQEYEAFCNAAREIGKDLLQVFGKTIQGGPLGNRMSAAIYLKGNQRFMAKRVAYVHLGGGTGYAPPADLPLISQRPAFTRAWWGEPVMNQRAKNTGPEEIEFVDEEQVVVCIPIRFGFKWNNPPPWGIVRLGILNNVDKIEPENTGELWTLLSIATMRMLTEALSAGGKLDAT